MRTVKPRWADEKTEDDPVMDAALSSPVVERAEHAGKMFKGSTFCGGQVDIHPGAAALMAKTLSNGHHKAHHFNKD